MNSIVFLCEGPDLITWLDQGARTLTGYQPSAEGFSVLRDGGRLFCAPDDNVMNEYEPAELARVEELVGSTPRAVVCHYTGAEVLNDLVLSLERRADVIVDNGFWTIATFPDIAARAQRNREWITERGPGTR